MIKTVVLSRQAQKDLMKVPRHVVVKFQDWVEDVEDRGLDEVRKVNFVRVEGVDKHVY